MSTPEGGWKVGDRAKAFGVMGTVTRYVTHVPYPIFWSPNNDEKSSMLFMDDGRLYHWCKEPSLIFVERPKRKVTKTIERWVNVYLWGTGITHDTEGKANHFAGADRIACVKLTGTYEVEE